MLRRLFKTTALILSSSALITGLTGCSANPENAPAIQKKFTQVDDMQDNLEQNNQLLRTITSDLAILKDQLSNMRAMDPNSEAGQDLLSRLEMIESQVGNIDADSERMISQLASGNPTSGSNNSSYNGLAVPNTQESAPAQNSTPSTPPRNSGMDRLFPPDHLNTRSRTQNNTSSSNSSSAGTTSSNTNSSSSASTPAPSTTSTSSSSSSSASTSSASRGRYYTLKSGETLETVAQSNGITVEKLRQENRIPNGARVLKGQRIYIPGS